MSVHVASWAWKQKVGDAGAKLLLIKLAEQANDRGGSMWLCSGCGEEILRDGCWSRV